MKRILIATATYNEAKNIKTLLKKIINLKIKLDILIIDDNSPDKTHLQIKEFMKKFDNIFLINRKKKNGLNTAHKYIYNFALKKNYDYLITMDADLSHDPNIIPKFLKQIKNYDFVIGSRYMRGGRNDLRGFRFFLSKFGNIFIRFMFNMNFTEFTTSYRCFNLKKLKKFNLKNVNAGGYSFFMEALYHIKKMGYSIKEIPIIFHERVSGKSKIPKIEIFRTLINIFLIRFKF